MSGEGGTSCSRQGEIERNAGGESNRKNNHRREEKRGRSHRVINERERKEG
jgi:hypothetical protein